MSVITQWGQLPWEIGELDIHLGNLRLTLAKSKRDVSTQFSYSDDVYWRKSEDWINQWRTVLPEGATSILLAPACPNRNVVARPVVDLFIPAQSEATIFVGYPAWLRLSTMEDLLLADLATELMSETWLGPNTRVGEVAYATSTHARLEQDNLPDYQHVVRTPVCIQNDSDQSLPISRISIPAPELTIYVSEEKLWTTQVNIHCDVTLSEATIKIEESPPNFLDAPVATAKARASENSNSVRRAIGFLLG